MNGHVFDPVTAVCKCGTTLQQAVDGQKIICPIDHSGPAVRAPYRSFDANPSEIGERLKEIQTREKRNL